MRHCLTLQPFKPQRKAMTTLQPYLRHSCRPASGRPPSLSGDGKQSTCYRDMPRQAAIVGEGGSHAWQSNEGEEGRHSRNRELGPFHFVDIEGCSDRSPTPLLQRSSDLDQRSWGVALLPCKRRHALPRKGSPASTGAQAMFCSSGQRGTASDDRAGRDIMAQAASLSSRRRSFMSSPTFEVGLGREPFPPPSTTCFLVANQDGRQLREIDGGSGITFLACAIGHRPHR